MCKKDGCEYGNLCCICCTKYMNGCSGCDEMDYVEYADDCEHYDSGYERTDDNGKCAVYEM